MEGNVLAIHYNVFGRISLSARLNNNEIYRQYLQNRGRIR